MSRDLTVFLKPSLSIAQYSATSFSPLHPLVISIRVNIREGCGKEVRIKYILSVFVFTPWECKLLI